MLSLVRRDRQLACRIAGHEVSASLRIAHVQIRLGHGVWQNVQSAGTCRLKGHLDLRRNR